MRGEIIRWADTTEEGRRAENEQMIAFDYHRHHLIWSKIQVAGLRVGRTNHTTEKRESYEKFEGLAKSIRARAPQTLKSIFQTAKNGEWALLHSE